MRTLRRYLLALVALSAAGGVTMASAASIGTVDADDLGAGVAMVASCDTDGVKTSFTTAYFASSPEGYHAVVEVVVSEIAAPCNGQDVHVTVTEAGGTELGSGSGEVAGTEAHIPIDAVGAALDAREVTGVSVVITGAL